MGINKERANNACTVTFNTNEHLLVAGKQFDGSVRLKVVSAIQVRGIFLEFYGYEQGMYKRD
jgi:hypothetical protein